MKNFFSKLIAMTACALMLVACSDDNGSDNIGSNNAWSFNNGKKVKAGSVLILESDGQVKALASAKSGLTTAFDFSNAEDCTEISFPTSAIGTDIDLTQLTNAEETTYFFSRLQEFGKQYGLLIDNENKNVSQGKITSSLEGGTLSVDCEFTTTDNIKFAIHLSGLMNVQTTQPTDNHVDYEIQSRNITKSVDLRCAFYLKNTWDDGWTLTYSVANIKNYIALGNNTFIEIFTGSDQLRNGKPFNVATTNLPFSLKFEYLDLEQQRTVPVVIDNTNRSGASGTVTLTKNNQGLYDAVFDVTLNDGDITFKGEYRGEILNRNMIYSPDGGNLATIRSATLNISSNPVVFYLSSKTGTAGPTQYDIKCEVPKNEWQYGKFMAFSGQGSSITWIDGVVYNKTSAATTSVVGGNWRVFEPVSVAGGVNVAECCMTLYGEANSFGYYYGEIKIVK